MGGVIYVPGMERMPETGGAGDGALGGRGPERGGPARQKIYIDSTRPDRGTRSITYVIDIFLLLHHPRFSGSRLCVLRILFVVRHCSCKRVQKTEPPCSRLSCLWKTTGLLRFEDTRNYYSTSCTALAERRINHFASLERVDGAPIPRHESV